jgi:hypothetical protein
MAAGGNRNVLNRPLGDDGQRDWSHGLFDCTDECSLCMLTSLVNFRMIWLNFFLWKVAALLFVPAWSIPRTNSVFTNCRLTAPLSRVGVTDIMLIVPFMPAWSSLAIRGSCWYVEAAVSRQWGYLLTEVFSLVTAGTSAHATTSVGAP